VARIFYRIVRGTVVTVEDFKSAQQLGKRLVNPAFQREWRDGISVYDDLAFATAHVRRTRYLLGRYVVALRIPEDGSIDFAQTTRERHHYTIYATMDRVLALVDGAPIYVPEE
jgi:hypothetical protein